MTVCSVFGCNKKSDTSSIQKDNVTFHLFPKELNRKRNWIKACQNHKTWLPKRTSKICSEHFHPSCFISERSRRRLEETAVPTLKLPDLNFHGSCDCHTLTSPPKNLMTGTGATTESPRETSTSEPQSTDRILLSPTASTSIVIQESPIKLKLRKIIQEKNKQIKRLKSETRYLKEKVANLEEILEELTRLQ